jgi:diguanylate cyclase (GGDEF)-like protein
MLLPPPAAADYVTGLEPRAVLEVFLQQVFLSSDAASGPRVVKADPQLSMLIVDVIGLKAVNEQDGFLAGDSLLRAAADRLRDAGGQAHLLARLGGDELVAVFTGLHAGTLAQQACDALAEAIAPPFLRITAVAASPNDTPGALIERLYTAVRIS